MRNTPLSLQARCRSLRSVAAVSLAAAWLLPQAASAGTVVYTLDAHFDLGVLSGVNHDAPNNHQLQLNKVGTTFPVLWVSNAGEDTVSKVDTTTGRELSRYRTWFGSGAFGNHDAFSGPAPSRSAVDIDGNVYVANRHFDGKAPMVMKILAEGSISRPGQTGTSTDLDSSGTISSAETMDVVNAAGANFDCDAAGCESKDTRVAWTTTLPAEEVGQLGRALCIGTDGNLWLGVYNSKKFYKIRSTDGAIIGGPYSVPWTPYGCLVDASGILWSASLDYRLGRLDTNAVDPAASAVAYTDTSSYNYGIALGNGKVYLASMVGFGFREFSPGSSTFSTPGGSKGFSSTGISVDGFGNIWTGPYTTAGVRKYDAAGTLLCSGANQFPGSIETRGVIVDSDNNIWQINRHTNSVAKYRGSDCTSLGNFPVGFDPYTYSDATGFAARNTTTPTGTWTVVNDSGTAGQTWTQVSWTDSLPAGTSIVVSVRASDVAATLSSLPYLPVANGANPGVSGRFIQVQARLNGNTASESPILYDLTLTTPSAGKCDADRDADIDQADLSLISRARGKPATGADDPRDSDNSGTITPNDVKVCIPQCTRANCAVQ